MDGPGDYHTKPSKSDKDKYHMILYVESKEKTNQVNKYNKTEIVIDTANKEMIARGEEDWGRRGKVREIKRYKLSITKHMSHRYEMYSVGNMVNIYIMSLVTEDN